MVGISTSIRYLSRLDPSHSTEDWPAQLGKLLQKEGNGLLVAVIDSAGSDIVERTVKILKPGAKIVLYGM